MTATSSDTGAESCETAYEAASTGPHRHTQIEASLVGVESRQHQPARGVGPGVKAPSVKISQHGGKGDGGV